VRKLAHQKTTEAASRHECFREISQTSKHGVLLLGGGKLHIVNMIFKKKLRLQPESFSSNRKLENA